MKRLLALLFMTATLAACAPSEPPLVIERAEIDGPTTLGLSARDEAIAAVVVYFHGMDQDAKVTESEAKHRAFVHPLLSAGYAVVSADAGGNAFGNPSSQTDYRRLIDAARRHYGTERLYFVAESMGALAALALLADGGAAPPRAMVGITPLMGIPAAARSINYVADAWRGLVPAAADPLSWPPQRLAGDSFRLYVADDDEVIPPGASAAEFATHFGSQASITIDRCVGEHVSEDCFDGTAVAKWLATQP